ncbi:MAG: TonB C-terminal domain-containing protein [bacterium]|nr:TonB C-terminal domain-containing protein [bacterium]
METLLSRRARLILITAALLLHVSLLMFLTRHHFQFNKPALVFFEQQLPERGKNEQAVQLVSHDTTQKTVPEKPPTPITKPVTPEPLVSHGYSPKTVPDEPKPEIKPLLPDELSDDELLDKPLPDNQLTPKEEKEEEEEKKETASEITKQENVHDDLLETTKIAAPKQLEKKTITAAHNKNPAHKNKNITLAQLTQGFKNYLKKEESESANHYNSCRVVGETGGVPTARQLTFERYSERIYRCLKNTYTIYKDRRFIQLASTTADMKVNMALQQDGTIKNIQLINPSGITELDDFILLIFQEASSEFPPVPNSICPYAVTFCNPLNLFIYQFKFSDLILTVR